MNAMINEQQLAAARACLKAAENDSMAFPQIVGALMDAGFESYAVNFRRATTTYYLPDGQSVELPSHRFPMPVAPVFDTAGVQAAIREAQQQVAGYSFKGFCEKVISAGCAGYIVSFSGRRALYIGRTAETHVELFPDQ